MNSELIVEQGTTTADEIRGRYCCRVQECPERFDTVGEKKRHLRKHHR